VYDEDKENRDLLVGSYHFDPCLARSLWNILDGDHYRRSFQMADSGAIYSINCGLHNLFNHWHFYDVF